MLSCKSTLRLLPVTALMSNDAMSWRGKGGGGGVIWNEIECLRLNSNKWTARASLRGELNWCGTPEKTQEVCPGKPPGLLWCPVRLTTGESVCWVVNMLKQGEQETDRQKKGKIQFTATPDLVMAVYWQQVIASNPLVSCSDVIACCCSYQTPATFMSHFLCLA